MYGFVYLVVLVAYSVFPVVENNRVLLVTLCDRQRVICNVVWETQVIGNVMCETESYW